MDSVKKKRKALFTLFEPCPTFLQGFEDTSKEALKARLCWVVRMVRGLLGLLGSFPSSPFPWLPMPFSGLMSNSSSSLFSAERVIITSLNWLHPLHQWQCEKKYILALPCSKRFTQAHNQRRDMCFWYFVINLLLKEKDTCKIRLTEVSRRAQWSMHICHWTGRRVMGNLLRSALYDLH